MKNDLLYQLALAEVPHIGNVHAKILCDHFPDARSIFQARKDVLEKIEGIGEVRAQSIKKFKGFEKAEKEIFFIEKYGISLLFLKDKDYPKRLLNCYDPPSILFYKGKANLNSSKIVAVVGTRNNTEYGKSSTEKLIKDFSGSDILIVSGLAFGIDAIAHKAAIKSGLPTIGVVGHGLDTIYPSQNAGLAREMLKEGGLLTEFKSNTKPDKHHFPSRNRVVAGLCDATIIIESGTKGGSMITAEIAGSYNRDVFALPGRITDIKSAGCNELIRNNKAILLENAAQFLEIMGWETITQKKQVFQKNMFPELSEKEKAIVELLRNKESVSVDELKFESNTSSSSFANVLLNLELMGVILQLPGKKYKLSY